MAYQTMIKRILYVAKCTCGWQDEKTENAPREVLCPNCKTNWCKYEEQSWVGQNRFGG